MVTIEEHPHVRDERRPWWFLPAVAGVALGGLVGLVTPETLPFLRQEQGPASSCEERIWPATEISCGAARNRSVLGDVPGMWSVRIWLTTLDAVDARLHPRQQVADHPTSGNAPVWLYIYEKDLGPGSGERVLHVAAASNARPGAYVYIYQWPELGSPAVPATMPSIR
jgi:hypothetical protein